MGSRCCHCKHPIEYCCSLSLSRPGTHFLSPRFVYFDKNIILELRSCLYLSFLLIIPLFFSHLARPPSSPPSIWFTGMLRAHHPMLYFWSHTRIFTFLSFFFSFFNPLFRVYWRHIPLRLFYHRLLPICSPPSLFPYCFTLDIDAVRSFWTVWWCSHCEELGTWCACRRHNAPAGVDRLGSFTSDPRKFIN